MSGQATARTTAMSATAEIGLPVSARSTSDTSVPLTPTQPERGAEASSIALHAVLPKLSSRQGIERDIAEHPLLPVFRAVKEHLRLQVLMSPSDAEVHPVVVARSAIRDVPVGKWAVIGRNPELDAFMTEAIRVLQHAGRSVQMINAQRWQFATEYLTSLAKQVPQSAPALKLAREGNLHDASIRHGYAMQMHERTLISRKRNRSNFGSKAKKVLRQWLTRHLANPYPTQEEKVELARESGMTVNQVNNWFINSRRRVLAPMIRSKEAKSSSSLSDWVPVMSATAAADEQFQHAAVDAARRVDQENA